MKRLFFKGGLFLALGLTAMFYSCSDDNDDNGGSGGSGNALTITATDVTNGSAQIATVKALAEWESGDDEWSEDEIAQAPYENNGFSLELPGTLPVKAEYLETIGADVPTGVSVSDKNAKVYFLDDIYGYNANGREIGYFYLEDENGDNEYYTSWMYTDRDVTIKGQYKYTDDDGYQDTGTYDLNLKKGWNIVYDSYSDNYSSRTYTSTFTSQEPSGVNYSWNFYGNGNGNFSSAGVAAKSVENKKSVSSKSIFSILKEGRKIRTRK